MQFANARRMVVLAGLLVVLTGCGSSETTDTSMDGEDPVRIGFLGALTGPFVIMGEPARNGMQLAVDDLNAAGGIAGRPVELIVADSESNPETAVAEMERMVESDVVAVGGVISSDVGLAASLVAEEDGLPLFLVKAGSNDILTQDSRFTFRSCLAAADMHMQALGQFIEQENYKRVGAIIGDYAWGHSVSDGTERFIGSLDEVELEEVVAPIGESDFTTYIRQLSDFEPDIIVATGHPPGVPSILKASSDFGVLIPVVGPSTPRGAVMEAAGDAALDRHVDFSCADFASTGYAEIAAPYADQYDAFMEDDAVAGYGIVTVIAEAVDEVGTQRETVAEYVHENTFSPPGYAWDLAWTDWGEFSEARPLLTVTRSGGAPEFAPDATWWPEVVFQSSGVQPYEPAE